VELRGEGDGRDRLESVAHLRPELIHEEREAEITVSSPRQSGGAAISTVGPGWIDPGFRIATKPAPSSRATAEARTKPRASMPAT
jgi:hypothetical protein